MEECLNNYIKKAEKELKNYKKGPKEMTRENGPLGGRYNGCVGVCRDGSAVLFGVLNDVRLFNDTRNYPIEDLYDWDLVSKISPKYDIVTIVNTCQKAFETDNGRIAIIWKGNENPRVKITMEALRKLVGRDFEVVG